MGFKGLNYGVVKENTLECRSEVRCVVCALCVVRCALCVVVVRKLDLCKLLLCTLRRHTNVAWLCPGFGTR